MPCIRLCACYAHAPVPVYTLSTEVRIGLRARYAMPGTEAATSVAVLNISLLIMLLEEYQNAVKVGLPPNMQCPQPIQCPVLTCHFEAKPGPETCTMSGSDMYLKLAMSGTDSSVLTQCGVPYWRRATNAGFCAELGPYAPVCTELGGLYQEERALRNQNLPLDQQYLLFAVDHKAAQILRTDSGQQRGSKGWCGGGGHGTAEGKEGRRRREREGE
eukprot:427387-Rhodomonas_salina.1